MWRITRLHLKNFIHIYSGIGKREITIDLSDVTQKVNLFIGKMGSGKSSILGHLQPFSTYGSLDIRNGEDLIIPEEDGLKEIDFVHKGHVYNIQHKYVWSNSSRNHLTKSYIQMDGTELNENGNVRSFKDIVRVQFGIDQNFLRLLRLGPNVANLINMKSTERKAFIASLLKDTEVYSMLHHNISEDYRNMNSAMSLLSNKLISLQADKAPELTVELDELKDDIEKLNLRADSLREKAASLQGANRVLLSNRSFEQMLSDYEDTCASIDVMQSRLTEINTLLSEISVSGDLESLNFKFGEASFQLVSLEEQRIAIEQESQDNLTERNRLRDQILLRENDTQLQELQARVTKIEAKYNRAASELQGFHSSYSYIFLTNLVTLIEQFQVSLDDMCSNSKEVIERAFKSDGSLIHWANNRLGILTGRRVNLGKLLSNIEFSKGYQCPIPLYRLPTCPSEDCPFVQTHPVVIARKNGDRRNKQILELQKQLDALDIEVAVCQDCIVQAPKMEYLKKTWVQISRVLSDIGALQEESLYRILMNLNARCNWYDHSALIRYTERVSMQENFESLKNQYFSAKAELTSLQSVEIEVMKSQLAALEARYTEILRNMEQLNIDRAKRIEEKQRYEELIRIMQNASSLRGEHETLERDSTLKISHRQETEHKMEEIGSNNERIKVITLELDKVTREYEEKSRRYNSLQLRLQDIKSASADYENYSYEKGLLKLIVDAVSSKDGIPLVMVKVFLDQCKEIINDLIADVFDDELEIVEFDISESSNDFKIPYRINGTLVPDIEQASQGQQAVISIALSFVLCRKSMFDYNIMLLDEIDNSIYKADRERFLMILIKQMKALNCDQVFLITHNDIFQQSNLPVNIIMTTPEVIDPYPNQNVMQV